MLCLRPGLVLVNDTRVNNQNCPDLFKDWDKIHSSSDVAPTSDEELDLQKNIREQLEKNS